MNNELTKKIVEIAQFLDTQGVTSYYVGGACRDDIMGLPVDDVDICLVNAGTADKVTLLLNTLKKEGKINTLVSHVGQQFPVWIVKIGEHKIDFAMARTEKLNGSYRTDFSCEVKDVTIEEDLKRRDITINAIAKNVITGEIIDPYNGVYHIQMRLCHPVSEAFKEDSLRVIRGARFCARFNLTPSWTFYDYAWELKPTDISPERVGMELEKVLMQATNPSIFFYVLRACNWLKYHFKELDKVWEVPQQKEYHPEGNVGQHTMYAIDEAKDWFTRVVMLCHDLGKATTTIYNEEKKRWQSIGHEEAGVILTRNMLSNIHFKNRRTVRKIETLVLLHMARIHTSEKTIRNNLRILMKNGLAYDELVEVCRCDVSSRPPLLKYTPDIGQVRAKEIMDSKLMIPVVTGEKLREKGIIDGAWMGWLIKKGLELQDRGTLNEENWWKVLHNFKQEEYDKQIITVPRIEEESDYSQTSSPNPQTNTI